MPRKQKEQGLIQLIAFGILGFSLLSRVNVDWVKALLTASPLETSSLATSPTCTVKGNISISSGKKFYHLPGMEDYDSTNIEPIHGERWFCSEAEAISAGWRKAPK